MDVVNKLLRSATITTWVSLLIRIGGLGLLLPIVLNRLSVQEALVWQMLSTVTALVLWLDFGFSPTFSRLIAFRRGGDDIGTTHHKVTSQISDTSANLGALVGTQRRIYVFLVSIAVLVSLAAGSAALLRPIDQLTNPTSGWVAWIITILAAQLSLINGSNASILVGLDRIAALRRVESIISALQLLTTALVTIWTGDLVAIVGCYSVWTIPMLVANRQQASRELFAVGTVAVGSFDAAIFKAIWPSVWRSGAGILFSTGIIQGSALIVPQFVPAPQAAAYLLALRLISIISQLSQAPFYSKLPAMAKAKGAGDERAVGELAMVGMRLAFWTYSLGTAALLITAPIALTIIGSSVELPNIIMLGAMVLAFYVERYSSMHLQLYTLTNRVIWHTLNGSIGIATVAISLLAWSSWGLIALPIAMFISYTVSSLLYTARISVGSINHRRIKFEIATSVPALIFLIFAFGMAMLI